MPGPDLSERLTLENVRKQGELLANLHDHAETFAPPDGFWLRRKDKVFSFGEDVVLFDEAHRHRFPPGKLRVYEQAIARVQGVIDDVYSRDEAPLVIHNDLHQWNVKVFRGRLYALDFEDLMWGFPVQDVAVTLYYGRDREGYAVWAQAFRQGYESIRPWPAGGEKTIQILMAARAVMFVNYVARIDPEPDAFIERKCRDLKAFLKRFG